MAAAFFKLYKPRKYNPRYIYYDEKKEAQKEREARYAEKEEDGEFKTSITRGTFRAHRNEQNRSYRDNVRQSNIRLVLIIGILFVIAYFIAKSI